MTNTTSKYQSDLYNLLLNEGNKIPDREGNTPLILKAIEISRLDSKSKEREFYENEVCKLSNQLNSFNQTNFSELDSFIDTAKLPRTNILNSFTKFIRKKEQKEDLVLKGCVARFIINHNKSFFELDYLKERFKSLKSLDPWLYAELIIKYNWEEGVAIISEILEKDNDTSYLFALITDWMTLDDSTNNLVYAFTIWEQYFTEKDLELLNAFREQYGFTNSTNLKTTSVSHKYTTEITLGKAFKNFINSRGTLQYESLSS